MKKRFLLTAAHAWGVFATPALFSQNFSNPPVKTCTVASIARALIAGMAFGRSAYGLGCTAGSLYKCQSVPQGTQNSCTLAQSCSIGCITEGNLNPLAGKCFSGTSPLTVSSDNILGGDDLTATVTLAGSQPGGAYVNLSIDRGDLIPGAYCAPPDQLPAGSSSASFGLSTAVVSSPTVVSMFTDLSYCDSSGVPHDLVNVPLRVTVSLAGTEPSAFHSDQYFADAKIGLSEPFTNAPFGEPMH